MFFKKACISIIETNKTSITFKVKNGKGLLKDNYFEYNNTQGFYTTYKDKTLIKSQALEYYFCPTCELLISAGHGEHFNTDGLLKKLNEDYIDINTYFANINPLLELLESGTYKISEESLIPTNGDDFFWKLSNKKSPIISSCNIYAKGFFAYGSDIPKFIVPSQTPFKLNEERVKAYRVNHNKRALAYYMRGYLCTLLDGHHKACAAALESRELNTIVISKVDYHTTTKSNKPDFKTNSDFDTYVFDEKYLNTKDNFLTAKQYLYVDLAQKYLKVEDFEFKTNYNLDQFLLVPHYMYYYNDERFIEYTINLIKNLNYDHSDFFDKIFILLAKVKDERILNLFIDIVFISTDEYRLGPHINAIINNYINHY